MMQEKTIDNERASEDKETMANERAKAE